MAVSMCFCQFSPAQLVPCTQQPAPRAWLNDELAMACFAVEPLARTWKYEGPALEGQFINVKRCQLPLAPAKVLPLYSMQGMTETPGLVAHWVLPPRVASDIKWLICYVTLSRVPPLDQLVSIGLSDKISEVIESGPPEELVQMFSTLCAKNILDTRVATLQAKQHLGW